MSVILVTGAAGLVGAASVRHFAEQGYTVVGIDNDMRSYFFGKEASTDWARLALQERYGTSITAVIHTAAQPSHDWAAREPMTDFTVNAVGTMVVLEACRLHAPDAVFVFTSTNKVYGDTPNRLPLQELATRWEIAESHPYYARGIDEEMSIDRCKHSLFGASKVAADVMVQEYGQYFGMRTGVFRGGCLTGPGHSGAQLHGFLAYLMKCAVTETQYKVFGYKGKQVRDNIHSHDLVNAFDHFIQQPRPGETYNIGGGRHSNCSMQEAIGMCERIVGRPMAVSYEDTNRIGDHIWWISDVSKFQSHYPGWSFTYGIQEILKEIHQELVERLDVTRPKVANS
jgi:CDP-paratose 2-epimerase